jgi:hypothetical protein
MSNCLSPAQHSTSVNLSRPANPVVPTNRASISPEGDVYFVLDIFTGIKSFKAVSMSSTPTPAPSTQKKSQKEKEHDSVAFNFGWPADSQLKKLQQSQEIKALLSSTVHHAYRYTCFENAWPVIHDPTDYYFSLFTEAAQSLGPRFAPIVHRLNEQPEYITWLSTVASILFSHINIYSYYSSLSSACINLEETSSSTALELLR